MAAPTFLSLALFSVLFGQLSGSSQYQLFRNSPASWEDAKMECDANGRKLAKISTAEDQKWVNNLSPYIDSHFWIGLKKKDNAESFTWWDSTDAEYTNWADGFPSFDAGFECVRVRPDEFRWETFNCSHEIQFLCEDPYFKRSPPVSEDTKIKGMLMGLGTIGGLLFLSCLLLQLPCCRYKVSEKIAHIGLGMRDPDFKPLM